MCLTSPTYWGSKYKNFIQWMYSSDHLILRWGKNIWFIELTDDKHYFYCIKALLFACYVEYITGQNYWSNCRVSTPPWWLTVYFLLDVRTEAFSVLVSHKKSDWKFSCLIYETEWKVRGVRGGEAGCPGYLTVFSVSKTVSLENVSI